MKDVITSDDILGKKAVDSDGQILGIVIKLHIDNLKKKILGITIDQGFMKPDLYMGLEFIKHFGIDAVLLNEFPFDKLKGLQVYTESGKHLGQVTKCVTEENQLKEIEYKQMLKKPEIISVSQIKEIGTSVIIKD
jgi:sporulation protein YlmC with PRC-barrel domain